MENEENKDKLEISKIKLSDGQIVDIKDALLRKQIAILLGLEQPDD